MIDANRMEMLFKAAAVRASQEQVSCEVDGEAIILNMRDGVYYGLNPVGARIWAFIQEPKSLDELQTFLLQEYHVEAEVCRRQVIALLDELAAKGLIEVQDGAAG